MYRKASLLQISKTLKITFDLRQMLVQVKSMRLLTGGQVPGQNCTITLKRTINELGNLNARKFAIRDLELGLALLKAGKVKRSGGQPLSFSRRIDSLPSSLVATRCPAMMSNGPKTYK